MYNTVTIKIGSNVLAENEGGLNHGRITELVNEISELHKEGKKVILVSSGAVAAARGSIKVDDNIDAVSKRQLLSSIGQVKLINLYDQLFEKQGIGIGQILVTKEDFRTRNHYLNMKNCITTLWDNNIIPIVNENDAVSVSALMFTDNDELSGMIATMMGCEALFILSNVDGIYNGHPDREDVEVIQEVKARGKKLAKYISTTKSNFGRGGMLTKCRIAQKTAKSGINVHIANGKKTDIICKLVNNSKSVTHTHFIAESADTPIKKWMAYSEDFAKAEVIINEGAQKALLSSKANSLLLAGVTEFIGTFKKNDLLIIKNSEGQMLGIGKAKYDKKTALIHMGDMKYKPVIHYDYLFVFPELVH